MSPDSQPFPDAETLSACERYDLLLRRGGGLPIRGRPLQGGRASGTDFEGHREYTPGLPLRHLDWNLYVRLRGFWVRTFRDEGAGRLEVFLDASGSMGFGEPTKLHLARRVAAVLIHGGLRSCHDVALHIACDGGVQTTHFSGGMSRQAFEVLGKVTARGPTALALAVDYAARTAARTAGSSGRGDAIVLGDLLDPAGPEPFFAALSRAGYRTDALRFSARGEFDLPESVRGVRDPESDGHAGLPLGRAGLLARIGEERARWLAAASRQGVTVHDVQSDTPLGLVLASFTEAVLRGRGSGSGHG